MALQVSASGASRNRSDSASTLVTTTRMRSMLGSPMTPLSISSLALTKGG